MKQIQIAAYFLIFIHFLRMIIRRAHSEKQCKHGCPNTWCPLDSSCQLALYYRRRINGNLNLYAVVFYLDDEWIRNELLSLLIRDFDGDCIHYGKCNPVTYLECFPLTHDRCIANAPILDITKWLDLVEDKLRNNFFNDPKHGNFLYEDLFIERIDE